MTRFFVFFLTLCVCSVLGNYCLRTNRRPLTSCADECSPSKGCHNPKRDCLCDGDCGYSCVKKNLKCRSFKLRNGKVIGGNRSFNATMKFVCDDKYTLFGSPIRRCRGNGKWDNRRPRCKIACPDPGIPDFAKRDRKKNPVGFQEKTVLTFYCFPGYELKTSPNIECKSSGQWSSSLPVCEARNCGRAILPPNSDVVRPRNWRNSPSHQYGQRLILRCKSGYRRFGLGIMRCEGSWKILIRDFRCLASSCGDPGTPRNGKKIGLAYTFKQIVRFSCDDCYTLDGAPYRQCQADGKWSDSLPLCKRVECSDPGGIENGEVTISSKPMFCNSVVDFKCSIGYNLKGVSQRTCTNDGRWSNSQPKCEIVDCGNPGRPRNGRTIAHNGFTYTQDVSFDCDDGYVMDGSSLSTCQANGYWSKDLPNCLEKCSDPGKSTNAIVVGKKFYHGMRVSFVCSGTDYILVPAQSKQLICEDGKWNGAIPLCKGPCKSLKRTPIQNGRVRSADNKHGSRAFFSCDSGYQLIGSSTTDCDDGLWSHPVPKCSAICEKISNIRNGWVTGNKYLQDDEISFLCKQNYVLIGQNKLTCRSNRRWSARIPICKAPCRKLQQPNHGKITSQGFKHNENIRFICDTNYVMDGQAGLTCSDGFWSAQTPRCFAPCKKFSNGKLIRGYIKEQGYRHGETVTFDCSGSYVIEGHSKLHCSNGNWDNDMPSCGEPCTALEPPLNGKFIKNGWRHREETSFKCNEGYKLLGQSHHVCHFGVWSGKLPSCKAICSGVVHLANGKVFGNTYLEGDQLRFQCLQGYVLDGQQSITCQSTRAWSAAKPVCRAICSPVVFLANGKVFGKTYLEGDQLRFQCLQGYVLDGQQSITCQSNRAWSAKKPVCRAICSPVVFLANGKVFGKTYIEGDQLRFQCLQGYVLDGQQSITCQSNRAWSAKKPVCRAICSGVVHLANGKIFGNTYLEGDQLRFQCLQGYVLDGQQSITCQSTRAWSATKPVCRADSEPVHLQCKNIKNIREGKVTGTGVLPGAKRTFTCKNYFNLIGVKKVTCLQSGHWDKTLPKCVYYKEPVKDCSPTGIKGARASSNATYHGAKVKFKCFNSTYVKRGSRGMRCVSGTWTLLKNGKPKCLAPCKVIAPPTNGIVSKIKTKHGGKVVFKCQKGYQLSRRSPLTCNDGSWNDSPPTCTK